MNSKKLILRAAAIFGLFTLIILLINLTTGTIDKPFRSKPSETTETSVVWGQIPTADETKNARIDPGTEIVEAHFINVENADATLLKFSDGKNVLVDSGYFETADIVLDYLRVRGITRLDALILTHAHADHCGAMPEILETIEVGAFYMPATPEELIPSDTSYDILLETLDEKNIIPVDPGPGEVILSGVDYYIEVLSDDNKTYEDLNDYSIILRVNAKNISLLLMGDAETAAEEDLLSSGYEIRSDILRVSHHGSGSSSTDAFLKKVLPKTAIISCNEENNEYGHPHKSALDRLNEYGIKVYRTDKDGTVIIRTDGEIYEVITERE
jgi:competence protein ComEC